jgi:hypothetical protein
MRPIIQLALSAFLITASVTASTAQDKPDGDKNDGNCFGVVMPTTGNLGSILIDRCSGKTWMFARSTPREGYFEMVSNFRRDQRIYPQKVTDRRPMDSSSPAGPSIGRTTANRAALTSPESEHPSHLNGFRTVRQIHSIGTGQLKITTRPSGI